MGTSHASHGQTRDKSVINAMSAELKSILHRHQLVLQRSAELVAQIGIFEKRQEYVLPALEESRRIAAEISDGAQRRVDAVINNLHGVIAAQQVEIARLEVEIAKLKQELEPQPSGDTVSPTPPSTTLPGSDFDTPGDLNVDYQGQYWSRGEQRHSPPSPAGKICVLEIHPEKDAPGTLEPQDDFKGTDKEDDVQAEDTYIRPLSVDEGQGTGTAVKVAGKREFSLREPQDEEIPVAMETGSSPADGLEAEPAQPPPTEPPRPEVNLLPMSVVTSERTELSHSIGPAASRELIEEREDSSIMFLDVFLDTRHFHFVDPWNKQVHGHRWQVKVQVEVPRTQEVAYSQLLSAVNSTLLRYGDVLLNDVFPFDKIEPSHENIAGYFFNCLEDMVAAKGLHLMEVSLWEKQNLVLQVHSRNGDIDAQLRGEGVLNQIRESLYHEMSADSESSFRKMLGAMFKNKN